MDVFLILAKRINELVEGLIRMLPQLAIALLVLLLTWVAARLLRRVAGRLLARVDIRDTLAKLAETMAAVLVWTLGLMVASSIVLPGVTPANLLTLLGLGSVAVGFAFKDIFENFLSGVLIMLRRQMRIGDLVECEGIEGRVENITLRDTHLRQLSNELVLVPNAYLFRNPLKIVTESPQRRHEVTIGVAYGTDLDAARALLLETVGGTETVDGTRGVDVFATEFGEDAIRFLIRWWAGSTPLQAHGSRDQVVRAIKRALNGAGIEIVPQRALRLVTPDR